jgi:hypothetical protein
MLFIKTSDNQMKKLITLYILLILLAIPSVLADSATIETTINESLHVTFHFTTNNPQLYEEIKTQGFNASTIPNIIKENFEHQNLKNAKVFPIYQEIFDDTTSSIHVEFVLAGSDIINYTLNEGNMTRTFRVKTNWRKIQVRLTQNVSLNFEESFAAPLTEWQQINYTTPQGKVHSAFEKSIKDDFEMSFRFILPEKAGDIQVEEDTIIFKVPLAFEDTLLNSPFLILGALIIVNVIIAVYRKARK